MDRGTPAGEGMTSPYRCETCKVPKNPDFPKYCPIIEHWVGIDYPLEISRIINKVGCASHSDFRSERDKVLDKLCKICPFLDERPETCENCVVETVRKEHRQVKE